MKKVKLENILPIILNEFSLNIDDVDVSPHGPEEEPTYLEVGVTFYKDFNKFEAVYILNSETQLYELFHFDGPEILHQCPSISNEEEFKKQVKESNEILNNYGGYKDYPIIRLSDIEREKEKQKIGGIYIRGKFYPRRN